MSQNVTVTWRGSEALAAKREGAIRGLWLGAELILGESQKIVPLDEATLQDSGRVDVVEADYEAIISYDTPYAVRQHEDLTLRHPNGREAKYLERPWRENAEKCAQIIAYQIKRALRS